MRSVINRNVVMRRIPVLLINYSALFVAKLVERFLFSPSTFRGHAAAQCLRHCAANLKVAGSISVGVTEIFH
jgi:hypothetical protein